MQGKFLVMYEWDNGYDCDCCGDGGRSISERIFDSASEAMDWIADKKANRAAKEKLGMDLAYTFYNFQIAVLFWSEEHGDSLDDSKLSEITQQKVKELEEKIKKDPYLKYL
jgi:hypothetical protein